MKIAQINMTAKGSTGNIMLQIAERAIKRGYVAKTFSTYLLSKDNELKTKPESHSYFGCYFENYLHAVFGKLFARNGFYSYFGTKKLIRTLKKFKPDVLQLHNLHNFCINLPLLFKYIKKYKINTVWTLHDCWAFTGQCPHFDMIGCNKWRTGCGDCKNYKDYPKVYWDNTKRIYKKKKAMFTGVENMTIVTPSEWLARLAKQSYLSEYPIKVINNGIDLSIFKPRESDFRERYNCKDNFIVLGVAAGWGKRKGFDVFLNLAKRLDDRYKIVLVGTNENIDKYLPSNVISIHKTENQTALAEIYSAADVFVNPTREETLGLTNIESLACGTPVVTFNTGGSPEVIDNNCGIVVEKNDVDGLEKSIKRICENKPFSQESCIVRANKFDKEKKFEEYLVEYEQFLKRPRKLI